MDHSSIPSQYCHLGLDPDNVMVCVTTYMYTIETGTNFSELTLIMSALKRIK